MNINIDEIHTLKFDDKKIYIIKIYVEISVILEKNYIVIGLVILILCGVIFGVSRILFNSSSKITIKNLDDVYSFRNNKEWVIDIDDRFYVNKQTAESELTGSYRLNNIQKPVTDIEVKNHFSYMLSEILVLSDAAKKGYFESQELKDMLWLTAKRTIVMYYLKKEMEKERGPFVSHVTPAMVDSIYAAYNAPRTAGPVRYPCLRYPSRRWPRWFRLQLFV